MNIGIKADDLDELEKIDLFINTHRSERSNEEDTYSQAPKTKIKKKKCENQSTVETATRRGTLPSLQLNMGISGTRLVPESLSFVRPVRSEKYMQRQKDYKTLPVDPGTMTGYSYKKYHQAKSELSRKPELTITKKFIESRKRDMKMLQMEHDRFVATSAEIPKWACVGFSTTQSNAGNRKFKVRSTFCKVNRV